MKRKYRIAAKAKQHDRAMNSGYSLPEFSQDELLAADKAYDAAKTDPAAIAQKIHALHQDEARMLRILGQSL